MKEPIINGCIEDNRILIPEEIEFKEHGGQIKAYTVSGYTEVGRKLTEEERIARDAAADKPTYAPMSMTELKLTRWQRLKNWLKWEWEGWLRIWESK